MSEIANLTAVIDANTSSFVRAMKDVDKQLDESQRAMGRYIDANGRMREANGRFVAGASRFNTSLGEGASRVDRLKQSILDAQPTIVNFGKKMTASVTLPILGMGTAAVMTFAKFDQVMRVAQVNLGATDQQMQGLKKQVLDLGKSTVFSATEVGNAVLELAKGGMNIADIQTGALAATLSLAAAEEMDLASAAKITTQAMNAYGIKAQDSATITDALAAASVASTADVTGLADGLTYVSSTAASMKLPLDDTITMLALLSNAGIDASTAGTSTNRMLLGLMGTTKKSREAIKSLGVSFYDAKGELRPMDKIIRDLDKSMGNLTTQERQQAMKNIFGVEGMRAANVLLAAGVDGWNKMDAAVNTTGKASELADARMGGLAGAIEAVKGSIETMLIKFTDAGLDDFIVRIADKIESLANAFTDLSPTMQKAIMIGAGIAAAIGPALIIIGTMIPAIAALASPVGLVIGAIVLLTAGIGALYATNEEFRAKVNEVWPAIQQAIASTIEWVNANVVPTIQAVAAFWKAHHEDILKVVTPIWNAIKQTISNALTMIRSVIEIVLAVIRGDWSKAWSSLKTLMSTALSQATIVLRTAFNVMKAVAGIAAREIVEFFAEQLGALKDWVSEKFDEATGAITEAAETAYDEALALGGRVIDGVLEGISGLYDQLKDKLKEGVRGAIDWVSQNTGSTTEDHTKKTLGEPISRGILLGFLDGSRSLPEKMRDKLRETIDRIAGQIQSMGATFATPFGRLADLALRAFDEKTKQRIKKIEDRFANMAKTINDEINGQVSGTNSSYDTKVKNEEDAGKELTPAEAALKAEKDAQAQREAQADKADALEALRRAQIRGNAAEILAAQKKLDDIAYAEKIAALERQAEEERKARDEDTAAKIATFETERDNALQALETQRQDRLAALETQKQDEVNAETLRREQARIAREDELKKLGEFLSKRNTSVKTAGAKLAAILREPGLLATMTASGVKFGQAFADALSGIKPLVESQAKALAEILSKYLKLRSPAEKGPLSSLDTWWSAMPDTLLSGIDAKQIGLAASGISAPDMSGVNGVGGSGNAFVQNVEVVVNIEGSVQAEQDLAETIRRELVRTGQRNGSIFGVGA